MSSRINTIRPTLFNLVEKIQPPDSFVLVITAVLVGAGTGLGAVIFVRLLAALTNLNATLIELAPPLLNLPVLLIIMGLAGLIVGYMVDRWAKEAKGHGVPEVMEAIALRGGRIRPRVALIKVVASSITIGFGGSAGREGPIVQAGSALGSTLGQVLRMSGDRIRTLVACGAAAGIAATFNAPIAGAIFALEVILGRFTTRYLGAVVLSSV
jgi:CIC family chloride channel protein